MMRRIRIALFLCVLACLLASCLKDHYDVGNVHGVNAEGEVLFPIGSGSYSVMELMQRFQIDSVLVFDASGNMSYDYYYEQFGVVKGEKLLRFNDLNYNEHFAFANPHPEIYTHPVDTMVSYSHTITFEAEHIGVVLAWMRTGHLDFTIGSNIGTARRVVIRSSDIKDAEGHSLELDLPVDEGTFSFDLDGMRYLTDSPNTLDLSYDLYFTVSGTTAPELYLDIDIVGKDFAIREMTGYVERYGIRSKVDTTFILLPDHLSGKVKVNDVGITLSERNTFGIGARLVVDTAEVNCEGIAPYSLFQPIPLAIDMPEQHAFMAIYGQSISGEVSSNGGRAYVSSDFIINPEGMSELVSVSDTCEIDVRVDVSFPLAFRADEVRYRDTVGLKLDEVSMPEWVKKLTLEITFNSTIPFDLHGRFMAYNTVSGMATDVFLGDVDLVAASYDGQPNKSTIAIEVTDERLQAVLQSDKLILDLGLDTDGHDIKLNASQGLDYYLKAKVEYDGIVELEE